MTKSKQETHVVVLMGGVSAEREVSLSTGEGVVKALEELGYRTTPVDVTADVGRLVTLLTESKPDVVFNALHGPLGEDGCIQGMLEWMRIPYTHSGVMASALAMNKPIAKKIFASVGLECPEGVVISAQTAVAHPPFAIPFVIKPLDEGSSVGVHIILTPEDLAKVDLSQLPSLVLVEKYIPGREIQVGVMGNFRAEVRALGAIEICPKTGFYDYRAKYTEGFADHFMPAPIHAGAYQEALRIAEVAHKSLECRGVSRVDLRYDDTKGEPGKFYILELNTQPGLTPLSLVPEIVAYHGMTYPALVNLMVEQAECT